MEAVTVQHVKKASSDELLRKFADLDDEASRKKELRLRVPKRRKTCPASGDRASCDSPSKSSSSLVERKSLLPRAATRRPALLRQLGIGRMHLRAREIRNKALLRAVEKTWRKTIEGASKVFIEKHYNRHKRLINDMV
ncbi:PREDICTED: uncharacterized protein LOC104603548 [Nelumbo nucifera]|uniref:Uncharacterized protein n=2 Tax=Nelumbo nucifera TaxID=4432 RepID=A0A822YFL1_NELNU|nr:PREDICTED: uncharacterized protein LOC104603548 [Nelumbo nucifera]DAD30019.1 TPA_asm: hypothetical protein HUJ06_031487 [Nelumbo nucifera]